MNTSYEPAASGEPAHKPDAAPAWAARRVTHKREFLSAAADSQLTLPPAGVTGMQAYLMRRWVQGDRR